jgi:hypothetical protein
MYKTLAPGDIGVRASLPVTARPAEVRQHIADIITTLGSPRGGLVLRFDVYPDVPLANIDALLGAVEEYQYYWGKP